MLDRMNTPEPNPALRNPSASEVPGLLAEAEQAGEGIAAFARARHLKRMCPVRALNILATELAGSLSCAHARPHEHTRTKSSSS